jgi:serine/threonine protein kinase
LSRFRNEAFAAGNLRHENIVTIHDYGDDDGLPYLVMELLSKRCRSCRRSAKAYAVRIRTASFTAILSPPM